MSAKQDGERIWKMFIAKPGAYVDGVEGIASSFAITMLLRVLKKHSPRRILELGSGIGTMTYAICWHISRKSDSRRETIKFHTVENNEYCIDQIERNLDEFRGVYARFNSVADAQAIEKEYDLIIVDGGGDLPGDMGIMDFGAMLGRKGVILIEGSRGYQRNRVKEWYKDRKCIEIFLKHTPKRKSKLRLFFFEPYISQRIYYRIVEIAYRVRFAAAMRWMLMSAK